MEEIRISRNDFFGFYTVNLNNVVVYVYDNGECVWQILADENGDEFFKPEEVRVVEEKIREMREEQKK